MIRKWLLPILAGLAVAAVAWHATLLATPYVLWMAVITVIGKNARWN